MGTRRINAVIYEERRLSAKSGLDHLIARSKKDSVAKLLNLYCNDR